MPAPETLLGLKISTLVAGFAGNVASLASLPVMPRYRMLLSLISGLVCAGYLTPLVMEFSNLPERLDSAVGFLVGMVALSLVTTIIKISDDPFTYLKKWRSK